MRIPNRKLTECWHRKISFILFDKPEFKITKCLLGNGRSRRCWAYSMPLLFSRRSKSLLYTHNFRSKLLFYYAVFKLRFSINVRGGSDIAFHFDVRYKFCSDRNMLVLNSFSSNAWGKEMKISMHPFPFPEDSFFEMLILVDPNCFKVTTSQFPGIEFLNY